MASHHIALTASIVSIILLLTPCLGGGTAVAVETATAAERERAATDAETAGPVDARLTPRGPVGGDNLGTFDLAPGASITIELDATVSNPLAAGTTFVSNQATITGANFSTFTTVDADPAGPDPGGDDATDTLLTGSPEIGGMGTTKTVSDVPVGNGDGLAQPGEVLAYTITVASSGTIGVEGVLVSDAPPLNTTLVVGTVTSNQGTVTSGNGGGDTTVGVDVGTLESGQSATVTFEVTVSPALAPFTASIDNTAQVSASGIPQFDTGIASILVDLADVRLSKTVDEVDVAIGEMAVFVVTATNEGPRDATGVFVDDLLPSGFTLVGTPTPSQGTYDPGTGEWDVGTLASGAIATLTLGVEVTPAATDPMGTGAFLDAFVGAGSGGLDAPGFLVFDADGDLYVGSLDTHEVLRYDGTTGAFDTDFVPVGSGGLDVPVGLVFGPDSHLYVASAGTGQVLRYDGTTGAFIDVVATVDATGLTFGPGGELYVADSSDDSVKRFDVFTGAALGPFVTSGGGGLAVPVGLVFGPDGHLYVASLDTDEVLRYDGTTGAFDTAFVTAGSGGLDEPFGLVFGPDGDLYVTSSVSDQVLRYDGATGAPIGVFSSGGGLASPAGLAFGADGNLYAASADSDEVLRYDGFLTNVAHLRTAALGRPDPDHTNHWAAAGVDYEKLDFGDAPDPLAATGGEYPTLLASDGPRHAGGGAGPILGQLWDLEVDGQPDATATGDDLAVIDDEDGVTFVSELVPSQTATIQVEVNGAPGLLNAWIDFDQDGLFASPGEQIATDLAVAVGTHTLTPTVSAAAALGSTFARFRIDTGGGLAPTGLAADGEVEDHLTPALLAPPVLSLTKDDGGASVVPGGTISYQLDYQNGAGLGTATGLELTETVPVGTTFNAAASTPGWTCLPDGSAGSTCTLALADLAGGAAASAIFAVDVLNPAVAGRLEITNDATLSAANTSSVMASETTPLVAAPDLSIVKTDGGLMVRPGDTLVYTLTYDNFGDRGASDVVLTETVPADTTFDAASSSAGWACTPDASAGSTCTLALGTVEVGAGTDATFAVTVDDPYTGGSFEIANTASIGDDGTNGPDSDGSNNSSTTTTTVVRADLGVTKGVDNPTPRVGERVTYTITVSNNGPQSTSGVAVSDPLAAGLVYVGDNPSQGSYDPATGAWSVGALASGASATLELDADVLPQPGLPGGGSLTNTAQLTASDELDPSPGNDSASVTVDYETLDFGDAPDPYPTRLAADGARHAGGGNGPVLGTLWDAETDGQPDAAATGDDLAGVDDEDGVTFTTPLLAGLGATVEVTVNGAAGLLNAWIDFDQSGSWETTEQIATDLAVAAGSTATVSFTVPATAPGGATAARFRVATAGGLQPTGLAADGEVEDHEVTIVADETPPTVTGVDTVATTPDGALTECETARVAVGRILVDFSEEVLGADQAASYRLLRPGTDRTFETAACGAAPAGDDEAVAIDSAAYDAGASRATLEIGGSGLLEDDLHRLLVCEAITDGAGNPLDGNGNGAPGPDFERGFRVDRLNLFGNGHFDCDLVSWELTVLDEGTLGYDPVDHEGSPHSGSARAANPNATGQSEGFAVEQCTEVTPAASYALRGRYRVDLGVPAGLTLVGGCTFFGGAACTGSELGTVESGLILLDTGGVFALLAVEVEAPAGAASARCGMSLLAPDGAAGDGFLDGLELTPGGLIFEDGFESGDTSIWSASVP